MKTYINPRVKLVKSDYDMGYFMWLKSRQFVIENLNHEFFMKDLKFGPGWYDKLPEEFYVGEELVNKSTYRRQINEMNLQYNNMDTIIFEIEGSCLFRDVCYNMNYSGQWAESNRFKFAVLDKDARFKEENYPISEEYKDIPEWERQFEIYMQTIKNDPIVDHNRLEMPYSISSRFWWGCSRKNLVYFLQFLKSEMPFFYYIYGVQMAILAGISNESTNTELLSSNVTKYVSKNPSTSEEKVSKIEGQCIAKINMGLILYSQFIRQAGTQVSGYYNLLLHKDPEEFKHKVFKGNTIFPIVYVATEDKVLDTIRTRTCAFAMSSGDDPCSWSHFINMFVKDLDSKTLMNYLPCTFKDRRLINCKFYQDIKFRNEGKEISNCPCPLVTLSEKHAEEKSLRDHNELGDAFKRLTSYLKYDGLEYKLISNEWTSSLEIYTEHQVQDDTIQAINTRLQYIRDTYSTKFGNGNSELPINKKYAPYFINGDNTCMMKGLAIDEIRKLIEEDGQHRFIINFGGDIYIQNARVPISIEDTKFDISMPRGCYSIFTSGNTDKRGDHIIDSELNPVNHGILSTVFIEWNGAPNDVHHIVDIMATKAVAQDISESEWQELISSIYDKLRMYRGFDFYKGQLVNRVYCASPFFNENQIKIRDKMVSRFTNAFRPDLTDSSKKFEFGDNEAALAVVDDNEHGIRNSDCLVFPMHTSDLGTLYEVGYAISDLKVIIKYNELTDRYEMTYKNGLGITPEYNRKYIFDCSKKSSVVALGYFAGLGKRLDIYYELKGCKDNLMLSVKYKHVEFNKATDKYELIKRDENDRDQ